MPVVCVLGLTGLPAPPGALNYFTEFWSLVAKTFSGKTNVLGYELMNEPWCGNPYDSV